MKTLGLYIHIPFCIKKCAYCDFYSIPDTDEQLRERYLTALMLHMDEYKPQADGYKVDTIYIGGGTPSLLTEKQLSELMKKINSCFHVAKMCETSIEVNPGTVDYKKLKAFKKCGINRLSIGAQSFAKEDLSCCGRIHSVQDNINTVLFARKAGFGNINLDLIYGLPNQNLMSIFQSLKAAFSLGVEHISFYGLKIEEGTKFYETKSSLKLPNEDLECEMYFSSRELLIRAGYNQYEISNFAKKGKYCRHNVKYWNCDEYLGLGPAAHSFFSGKRFSFKKDLGLYIQNLTENTGDSIIDEYIDIPRSARIGEYVMLRFRLRDGINAKEFYSRFGRDFDSIYYRRIQPYINSGHIVRTEKGYAFSPEGMYVSNYLLSRIVDFDLVVPGV